ncbi:MAG: triosephosphate isomerase [Bacteroidetes bacterium]|jgi:triosephosphate isomerase|nr:triosephosphate isomerase [Bacteroidota bacterium]MDF2453541.1 triosephosphate isomerase [Bacteroidota bacterium]
MSRQKIVAGNWKMNKSLKDAKSLVEMILSNTKDSDVLKIIIPPFPYLEPVKQILSARKGFYLGAQNCHTNTSGAFTGEVSANMLQSVGCQYVIIGHSERRNYFKEKSTDFVLKIREALKHDIIPIYCIGETLEERKNGYHFSVITEQLTSILSEFKLEDFSRFVLAYEPVWAIGTGETATAAQAQEMHAFIRSVLCDFYDSAIAGNTPILYGGSCNAQNARELFQCPDVDGGLIGGASLNEDFCTIIGSF